MLFNSLDFLLFFPLVFLLYWAIPPTKVSRQNFVLLVAGYFFYGCWDPRFLILLAFSTLLDFIAAQKIAKASGRFRKTWLILSICINLGFLGIFKYYDFFITSFADLLSQAGLNANPVLLEVILPLGISFYTFHGLSYILDVYNGKTAPTRNLLNYSVFICFFPLLVAGPIERSTHLLPQLEKSRQFNYAKMVDGLKQVLWGFFKKIVIADSCAPYVNSFFADPGSVPGSAMAIGVILFAIQIYCDFSGYSDIALGTSRLMGIEVLRNFNYPYFSRDIAEFWRRWHISLSSWFRDYVYIPMGGSQAGRTRTIRNVFIIFVLSGLWHGANVTFIVWGFLHAVYFLPLLLFNKNRINLNIADAGRALPSAGTLIKMGITFFLVCFAWIFFRAENMSNAYIVIQRIFSVSFFDTSGFALVPASLLIVITAFFVIEWMGRHHAYPIRVTLKTWPRAGRWAFYYLLLGCIIFFAGQQQKFIYFQF